MSQNPKLVQHKRGPLNILIYTSKTHKSIKANHYSSYQPICKQKSDVLSILSITSVSLEGWSWTRLIRLQNAHFQWFVFS